MDYKTLIGYKNYRPGFHRLILTALLDIGCFRVQVLATHSQNRSFAFAISAILTPASFLVLIAFCSRLG